MTERAIRIHPDVDVVVSQGQQGRAFHRDAECHLAPPADNQRTQTARVARDLRRLQPCTVCVLGEQRRVASGGDKSTYERLADPDTTWDGGEA
jgi:hypothetical protein